MIFRVLSIVSFIFLFSFFIHPIGFASTIFQDDFNDYPEDTFPTKWEILSSNCSAQWHVEDGAVGIKIQNQGSCSSNIIPKPSVWGTALSEYIYDVDAKFVNGTDHNIGYRTSTDYPNTIYELHFQSPGDFNVSFPEGSINLLVPHSYLNDNLFHHFRIIVLKNNLKVYFDGELVRDILITSTPFSGEIALRAGTGADANSEAWFDNVKVTTIDDQDTLPVPSLKQNDSLWGSQLYDSANLWSSNSTDIASYGCALTSAAMVFEYNGIKKLPGGEDLNPGTLNNWLKSQDDGYVRNGLVNWLALSRLSMQAKPNNDINFDALEYSRVGNQNDTILATSLNQNTPPILEEPGHFVVATGTDSANTTFFINDPAFPRTSLADSSYNKTYSSMGIYTQSQTNLSYMMLVVNPNINVSLVDNEGDSIGNSFIQNTIADDVSNSANSVGPLKIFYFQKPSTGRYTLKLTSSNSTSYALDEYLYDKNGEFTKSTFTGDIPKSKVDSYIINFDQNNNENDKFDSVNFDYIKNEIINDYNNGEIKNYRTYMSLLTQLSIAQRFQNSRIQKAVLNNMIKTIKRDKKFDESFALQLTYDIQLLQSSF